VNNFKVDKTRNCRIHREVSRKAHPVTWLYM